MKKKRNASKECKKCEKSEEEEEEDKEKEFPSFQRAFYSICTNEKKEKNEPFYFIWIFECFYLSQVDDEQLRRHAHTNRKKFFQSFFLFGLFLSLSLHFFQYILIYIINIMYCIYYVFIYGSTRILV